MCVVYMLCVMCVYVVYDICVFVCMIVCGYMLYVYGMCGVVLQIIPGPWESPKPSLGFYMLLVGEMFLRHGPALYLRLPSPLARAGLQATAIFL